MNCLYLLIIQKIMKSGFKLNKVTFKLREGDKAGNLNECAIGGKWVDKNTDDFSSIEETLEKARRKGIIE